MPRRKQKPLGGRMAGHVGLRDYRVVEESNTEAQAKMVRAAEEWSMEGMLAAAGYKMPRQYAKQLAAEGIGPDELRERMRLSPGAVGSLQYTHRFEKR